MTNFYHSGLYSEPFYKKINNLIFDDSYLFDTICDDYDAFLKHYKNQIEKIGQSDNVDTDSNDSACRQILELVLLDISKQCLYFQPLIFKPDIALECGLIPFVTKDIRYNSNSLYGSSKGNKPYINVLILSPKCYTTDGVYDLFPRLDAYQALTDNSIDHESYLFEDEEYFESVVGKGLTQKVLNATYL